MSTLKSCIMKLSFPRINLSVHWTLLLLSLFPSMKSYKIFYTDANLKRYGGTDNTFSENKFTQLLQNDPNVVFIPVNNGKGYFSSTKNKSVQDSKIKYEPLLIPSNDFHHLFSFLLSLLQSTAGNLNNTTDNKPSSSTYIETIGYDITNFDVNEIFNYIGLKNGKHYVSVEFNPSKYLNTLIGKIDIDSILTQYIQSNSRSNSQVITNEIDKDNIKLITCNLRKIINDYYEDDLNENKQFSTLLAVTGGYSSFHCSTLFCRKCGHATKNHKCGNSRICMNPICKSKSYPRVEPATIMLIESKCHQYCLLGRKSEWVDGCYSTLAGFTELGETLEQTGRIYNNN